MDFQIGGQSSRPDRGNEAPILATDGTERLRCLPLTDDTALQCQLGPLGHYVLSSREVTSHSVVCGLL